MTRAPPAWPSPRAVRPRYESGREPGSPPLVLRRPERRPALGWGRGPAQARRPRLACEGRPPPRRPRLGCGLDRLRGFDGLRGLGGLRRLLRLLGLLGADQTLALGLAAEAVSLRVFDARRVGLDPDAQRPAEIERLLVGESELLGELVHAKSCLPTCVRQPFPVLSCGRSPGAPRHGPDSLAQAPGPARTSLLSAAVVQKLRTDPIHGGSVHRRPKGPSERVPLRREIEAGLRPGAQPGTTAPQATANRQRSVRRSDQTHQIGRFARPGDTRCRSVALGSEPR